MEIVKASDFQPTTKNVYLAYTRGDRAEVQYVSAHDVDEDALGWWCMECGGYLSTCPDDLLNMTLYKIKSKDFEAIRNIIQEIDDDSECLIDLWDKLGRAQEVYNVDCTDAMDMVEEFEENGGDEDDNDGDDFIDFSVEWVKEHFPL